ncbi:hypothetical protein SUDANB140_04250 [Streptomyces sp. enrichment culture]
MPPSLLRQRPFEDLPRPGPEEGAENTAQLAAAPSPCNGPVVSSARSRRAQSRAIASSPATPRSADVLASATRRSNGIRHSSTVSPRSRSAARIPSQSFSSATARTFLSGRASWCSCARRILADPVVFHIRRPLSTPAQTRRTAAAPRPERDGRAATRTTPATAPPTGAAASRGGGPTRTSPRRPGASTRFRTARRPVPMRPRAPGRAHLLGTAPGERHPVPGSDRSHLVPAVGIEGDEGQIRLRAAAGALLPCVLDDQLPPYVLRSPRHAPRRGFGHTIAGQLQHLTHGSTTQRCKQRHPVPSLKRASHGSQPALVPALGHDSDGNARHRGRTTPDPCAFMSRRSCPGQPCRLRPLLPAVRRRFRARPSRAAGVRSARAASCPSSSSPARSGCAESSAAATASLTSEP